MIKKLYLNRAIMRPILLAIALFSFAVILTLQSCGNPVRRVMNDPHKFNQVASEVIRRGYCITDTARRVSVQESTSFESATTSATVNIVTLPGKDSFTVTSKDGSTVHQVGSTLTVTSKVPVKTITRTVESIVVDKSQVNQLRQDLLNQQLAADSTRSAMNKTIEDTKAELKAEKVSRRLAHLKLIGVLAAVGLWFVFRIVKKFI